MGRNEALGAQGWQLYRICSTIELRCIAAIPSLGGVYDLIRFLYSSMAKLRRPVRSVISTAKGL